MTEVNEIYKCEICGNIVKIIQNGVGTLVCCNVDMVLQIEKTQDLGLEKHVPIIEKDKDKVKVIVGKTLHPMQEAHYIQLIEVITKTKVYEKFLKPNEKPEAEFIIDEDIILVRAYCNIHGLWKK